MQRKHSFSTACLASVGVFTLSGLAGAQFVNNTSDIPTGAPFNNSESEHIDFGDVDLDGDWDAIWGDGGDGGNDQNRIWINQGGSQGGTLGVFQDRTSTQFPSIQDDTRDVEFVDFDADGDLDIYSSNTSQIQNQSNLWWTNMGGEQGGTAGNYQDQTASRWSGVGGAGSSVAPSQVLGSGGFIDWSCDCDFGDLDNDGDMDLVHSTYGSGFGGLVPTRLFVNDGDGVFTEYNPSGFQLTGATLAVGQPALWSGGNFQPNTTNTTGGASDIATNTLDIDVGDTDGDYDLDILHGDRDANPRFFINRLEEDGPNSRFWDISQAAFGSVGDRATTGNYEQELGDIDGDGDLDLYGLNWTGFNDIVRKNNGNSIFGSNQTLPGSGADDNEGDFFDADNDGDLDIFVANFSGNNKLYDNDGNGNFTLTQSGGSLTGGTSLDADAADVDGDGDYDLFISNDGFQTNRFIENVSNVPDTTPAYIPRFERAPNGSASASPIVIRAQVYDNAPYYITWFNDTDIELSVDGCNLPNIDMVSSGGQIFRGELPGNLLGTVTYNIRSTDEHGNSGTSSDWTYNSSTGLSVGGTFGIGQGAGSLPQPNIAALSVAFPNSSLYVAGSGLPAGTVGILSLALFKEDPAIVLPPFGMFNVNTAIFNAVATVDSTGCTVFEFPLGSGIPSGASLFFQYFGLNLGAGDLLASSEGLEVISQ